MNDSVNPYAPPEANIIPAPAPGDALALASRWHRILASLLDALIIMVVVMPFEWLAGTFGRISQAQQSGTLFQPESILWSAIGLGAMVLINWNPLLTGQTIGKRVLKIKVVRNDGTPCDRKHLILWRMLPLQVVVLIPFIGAIAAIADCFSIFRSDRRTLHDLLADTKVVDLRQQLVGG